MILEIRQKKYFKIIFGLFFLFLFSPVFTKAHPGDIDSYGCHICTTNCITWDLSYGEYHCHGNLKNIPVCTMEYHTGCISENDYNIINTSGIRSGRNRYAPEIFQSTLDKCRAEIIDFTRKQNEFNTCLSEYQQKIDNAVLELNQIMVEMKSREKELLEEKQYNDLNNLCVDKFGSNSFYDEGNGGCGCVSGYEFNIKSTQCIEKCSSGLHRVTNDYCACDGELVWDNKKNSCVSCDIFLPNSSAVNNGIITGCSCDEGFYYDSVSKSCVVKEDWNETEQNPKTLSEILRFENEKAKIENVETNTEIKVEEKVGDKMNVELQLKETVDNNGVSKIMGGSGNINSSTIDKNYVRINDVVVSTDNLNKNTFFEEFKNKTLHTLNKAFSFLKKLFKKD